MEGKMRMSVMVRSSPSAKTCSASASRPLSSRLLSLRPLSSRPLSSRLLSSPPRASERLCRRAARPLAPPGGRRSWRHRLLRFAMMGGRRRWFSNFISVDETTRLSDAFCLSNKTHNFVFIYLLSRHRKAFVTKQTGNWLPSSEWKKYKKTRSCKLMAIHYW